MTQTVLVLNGPNLNLLGSRQPEIYGPETLHDIKTRCEATLNGRFALDFRQSNHEGELVTWIQQARGTCVGIVINAAAYTHTSVAILDALNMFDGPVIEVHISDIHKREAFRHFSYVSLRADHVIIGRGTQGYSEALEKLIELIG